MKLSKKLFSLPVAIMLAVASQPSISTKAASTSATKDNKTEINKPALSIDGKKKLSIGELLEKIQEAPEYLKKMDLTSIYRLYLFNEAVQRVANLAATKQGLRNSVEFKKAMTEAENTILSNLFLFGDMSKNANKFTDQELKDAYEQYKQSFVAEKYVAAKHFATDNESKAKEFLEQIKKESKDNMESKFVKLAEESSILKKQTEIKVTESFPIAVIKDAVYALVAGNLSEVVKNGNYYHVFYRLSTNDTGETKVKTFEELKEQKGILEAMAMEKKITTKIEEAFTSNKVKLFDINGQEISRKELQEKVQSSMLPSLSGLKR